MLAFVVVPDDPNPSSNVHRFVHNESSLSNWIPRIRSSTSRIEEMRPVRRNCYPEEFDNLDPVVGLLHSTDPPEESDNSDPVLGFLHGEDAPRFEES